jgi:hypothetical protein
MHPLNEQKKFLLFLEADFKKTVKLVKFFFCGFCFVLSEEEMKETNVGTKMGLIGWRKVDLQNTVLSKFV